MDQDQVLLSDELLAVCRAAVTFAVEYGASFVAPPHGGRFMPKYLALGITAVAQDDQNVRSLLGKDPEVFKEVVYALK